MPLGNLLLNKKAWEQFIKIVSLPQSIGVFSNKFRINDLNDENAKRSFLTVSPYVISWRSFSAILGNILKSTELVAEQIKQRIN